MKAILSQAIQIKLARSNLIFGLLSGVSIVCCLIIASLTISLILKFVIIALILLSSAYFIARDALLLLPWSWQMLQVDTKGELTIINKHGLQFQPALAPSTFIHAACTILNFKRAGLKFALPPLILFVNTNNREELRRLRVWLRWFKHQQDFSAADLAS